MTPLPEFVDPRVWAEQGNTIDALVELKFLPRILDLVDQTQVHEPVGLTLRFGFDEQKRPQVTGRIQAQLVLVCQRCSKPIEFVVDEPLSAHPVAKADMPTNNSRKDGQGWEDDFVYHENAQGQVGLAPLKLAEDEIILALPLVAMHDADDPSCQVAWVDPDLARWSDEDRINEAKADDIDNPDNPFAVLASLKNRQDSN